MEASRKLKMQKDKRVLQEALDVLEKHQRMRVCDKHLKAAHYLQLLIHIGHKADAYEREGARKGRVFKVADLRRIYWHYHEQGGVEAVDGEAVDDEAVDGETADNEAAPVWDYSDEEHEQHSEAVPFLIGTRVKVFWPGTKEWYEGVVNNVDQADSTYEVHYKYDNEFFWHDLSWKVQLLD